MDSADAKIHSKTKIKKVKCIHIWIFVEFHILFTKKTLLNKYTAQFKFVYPQLKIFK